MDAAPRKIEVIAPFSAAFDLTRLILFQPFDFGKWLTIGFAAFLAGLADGTRMNFNFSVPDFSGRAQTNDLDLEAVKSQIDGWLVGGVIALIVAIVLVLILLFMWLGSRGRFMFVDCIVRNRGAIEEPWREYRREGNSLFLWALLLGAISLLTAVLAALPFILRYLSDGTFGEFGVGSLIYVIGWIVFFVLAGFAIALINWFMVPVMYRQRCNARTAFMIVVRLILSEPAPFILYVLFGVFVVVGGAMLSCLAICLTCCVAAIPYVGTVILLPLYTFYYAYGLLFLRQFGPEYDVWATLVPETQAITQAPPSDETPPLPA